MNGPTAKRGPGRPSKAEKAAALAAAAQMVASPLESLEPAPDAQIHLDATPDVAPAVEAEHIPAHHRENPEKLSGQALRDLAHKRGISRSESAGMTDEKVRLALRYAAAAWDEEN